MKKLTIAAAACGLFLLGHVSGQEGEDGGPMPPQPEWTKLTEHHEAFADTCGEYEIAGEHWMAPGAPPQPFTATAKREMLLGGYYCVEHFKMPWMGKTFEGRLLQGYDTVKKQHVNVWTDNHSPVPNISTGQIVDGVMTMTGEAPDYMTGKIKETKQVIAPQDDGTVVMTFYDVTPEGDRMTMRMVYTRKK